MNNLSKLEQFALAAMQSLIAVEVPKSDAEQKVLANRAVNIAMLTLKKLKETQELPY